MSNTFDVEVALPVIDEMGFSEDFRTAIFRIVDAAGGGARVHVSPFELATMITRLSEMHLYLQSVFLDAQLGAHTTPLKVGEYGVDPSLSEQSVILQFRPKGKGTSYLGYTIPSEMARRIAHELLAAADMADNQQAPIGN